MSETIIIESNRQIAYKQEKRSLFDVNEKDANVVLPNNAWKTRLESGVKINVGDQIQIEAVMVNTRGSPEETIEFTGNTTVQDASDVTDNKALLRVQKYITNRQQFNCNLPLFGSEVEIADPKKTNYGYLDFSTFANFMKNYPYRGIEGMYLNAEKQYTEVAGGGIFAKPPAPLDNADPTRLYLGADDFVGYSHVINSPATGAWSSQTTDIPLEVEVGFNTPSNVGETLTAQLHQRQGDPTNWTDQQVQARYIFLQGDTNAGQFVSVPNAGITDLSYQTVPTSTGDVFRARSEGKWSSAIAGEVTQANEGTNYQESQGRELFHRNLLIGNPNEYRAVYGWLAGRVNAKSSTTISIADQTAIGIYTGTSPDAEDVGNWGLNTVLLDELDHTATTTSFTYGDHSEDVSNTTDFEGRATIAEVDFLTMPEANTLLVTNLVYNRANINNMTVGWTDNEIPVDQTDKSKNATPLTQDLSKSFYQQLYYGRANDQLSCGAVGAKINLPTTNQHLDNTQTTLTSYQPVDPNGINKKTLIREYGEGAYDNRNHINSWSRYDPKFDQTKKNAVQFTFPSTSKFQLTNSQGKYHPQGISVDLNIAIIPVFYKQADLPDANLKDIAFCAFITINPIAASARMPCPMAGEFFGRSPSCYDNLMSKVITTQKHFIETDSSSGTPVPIYPKGDLEVSTRPYQYMPYCMIGADNPTIAFDATYGRFTISGLHTALRAGNGVFQELPDELNEQASTESMCSLTLDSAICGTSDVGEKIPYSGIRQSSVNNTVISSQSGISIQEIFLYSKRNLIFEKGLDPRIPVNYEGSLFSKMGFRLEQLLPYVGQIQSNFNRGSYGRYLGTSKSFPDKYQTMVKPFTTNAYISGADQLSMVLNAAKYQMENLGGNSPNQSIFINAQSDSLVALDLPSKLDYAYLIVYSNIVQNTQFYGGGNGQQKIPAMAYVSRNYSTGDFFFGQESSWTYIADKEYIITEFDTNITLPNGLPAPIESNSSIIYKITKPKVMPPPPNLLKKD